MQWNRKKWTAAPWAGLLAVGLCAPLPGAAQEASGRLVPTAVGTVAGVAAGGYLALGIIVAEARVGRYMHDMHDVLGWRSVPVVAGGLTGAALGFYSPRRLEGAVIYGTAGLGAGALGGWALGSLFWEPPEGRWAGAAIGAGLGLMAGNLYGILRAGPDGDGAAAGIPLMVRLPL